MATTTIAIPKTKGGAFLLERRAPEEIFTPEDFTAEHRAIAKTTEEFFNQGSRAASGRDPASAARRGRRDSAQIGRAGTDGGGDPREIRRHGDGPDVDDGGGRRRGARWVVCGLARRAHRHRHAAAAVVRHRGAEGEISAEAGLGGNDRGVLSERAAGRLGRAGRAHPRRSCRPTARTTSSTARRCGSPTAASRICTRCSPKSAAKNSRHFWWSAPGPAFRPEQKNRRWGSRAAPPRPCISTT